MSNDCVRFRLDASVEKTTSSSAGQPVTRVYFHPGHYTVMENIGQVTVTIARADGDLDRQVAADYCTQDGGALAGKGYVPASGTVVFSRQQTEKKIRIDVIDNSVYKGDRHFYIRLFGLRFLSPIGYQQLQHGYVDGSAYHINAKKGVGCRSNNPTCPLSLHSAIVTGPPDNQASSVKVSF